MLSDHAIKLLEERYLLKDEDGNIIETPDEFFVRVAKHGAKTEEEFRDNLEAISSFKFVPSRTPYMGTERPFCSSCFVLGPIEDDTDSILDVLKQNVAVQRYGGGAGFNFSRLRPQGDVIKKTKGKASGPVSFMQLYDSAMRVFLRAGNKMGAQMAVLNVDHPDIEKFITCKDKEGELTTFNISVAVSDSFMQAVNEDRDWDLVFGGKVYKTIRAKDLWRKLTYQSWKNGEPGIIFIDTVNRRNKYPVEIDASNPCVVGDTLVAVADGRDFVSIRELAQDGKDVPVYSYGKDGMEIKIGRNPRLTRKDAKIVRVTLDDGSFIRTTEDHLFMLRDGTYKRAANLVCGDSLMPFNKSQYYHHGNFYWSIYLNKKENNVAWSPEHRMICEHAYNKKIRYPTVIHHKDYDGLNNKLDNLSPMNTNEHTMIHSQNMIGNNNPMRERWWDKLSEEEKDKHREKISQSVSGSRNGMFGKKHTEETKRLIGEKASQRMTPEVREKVGNRMRDYYSLPGTRKRVKRVIVKCRNCKDDISLLPYEYKQRLKNKSGIFCSIKCAAEYIKKNHIKKEGKKKYNKEDVILLAREYCNEFGSMPDVKGWDAWSRGKSDICSREIVRKIFGGFPGLRDALSLYNHRVVSVVDDGMDDVYNITVDDNHNLAYITNTDSITPSGKKKITGIITKNCGEQFLPPSASCNLGSINLSKFVTDGVFDWEQFERYVRIGVRFLDTSLERAWWPLDGVRETTLKYKNIGLGIMGFADALIQMQIPYDSDRAVLFANNVGEFLITVARDESDKMGSNNTTLTTIAPTGSIATLAGCSYGIEPIFAVSFTKNTLLGSVTQLNEQFIEIAKRRGFYTEELVAKIEKSGSIQDIPEVPQDVKDVFKTAGEISVDRHVEIQAAFQKHVCNAISKTINLHNSATVEEVGRVYMLAYNSGCKSTTVYRDGSRVIQAMDAGKDKKKEQKWELYISDPGCISGTCSL